MILAGGSFDQLPQERIHGLSNVLGNSALCEILAMRSEGPRFSDRALPNGACDAAPMAIDAPGEPVFAEGSPTAAIGNAQPMTLA